MHGVSALSYRDSVGEVSESLATIDLRIRCSLDRLGPDHRLATAEIAVRQPDLALPIGVPEIAGQDADGPRLSGRRRQDRDPVKDGALLDQVELQMQRSVGR